MLTYQKVVIGLVALSFALQLIAAAHGMWFRPLDDPIGGGSPG